MAKTKDDPAQGRATKKAPAEKVSAPGKGRAEWWLGEDGAPFKSGDDYIGTRGEYMNKSVFTTKSQELASLRQALDTERQRFDLDRQEYLSRDAALEKKAKEYEQYDRLVKERPDVYKNLQKQLNDGPGPDVMQDRMEQMFEEKYGPQINELSQYKLDQESTARRKEVFDALTQRYPDFDADATDNDLAELTAKLQDGDLGYLAERLHLSRSGLITTEDPPVDDTAASEDADETTELMSPGSAPVTVNAAPGSLDEAYDTALREYAGT